MSSKNKKKTESYILDEWKRYEFKLDEKEKAYARKFFREYHKAEFYGDTKDHIIVEDDIRKEAIHNHNAKNLDAINKIGSHNPFLDESTKEFMEDASDDWEWMDTYKLLGYKCAVDIILNQAITNIQNKYVDTKMSLIKFHLKMDKLRILNNRDKLIEREKK